MTKKSLQRPVPKRGSSPPAPPPSGGKPPATAIATKPAATIPKPPPKPPLTPAAQPRAERDRSGFQKGVITAEMRATAKGSPTAEDLLLALKHEGKPSHISDEKYLQRFARYGWHEEEDEQARAVLKVWSKNNSKNDESRIAFRQHNSDEETPIIDKAVNTIEALQEVAEDYERLLELRENDPAAAAVFEEEFRERWQGLDPDDIAWFADDGIVTLDEMIAMILVAEGGSIAQSEELIIYLANRAHNFVVGAKEIADAAGLDWSQFMTAEGLLEAYALDDPDNPTYEVARRIINNIFGHDDSFFGAQDRDYERNVPGARSEQEQITAWINLTTNPEQVSSGFGETILSLATQVADPEQWNSENTRRINGSPVYTQANNTLINPDDLNLQLEIWGIGQIPSEARHTVSGGETIFLNYCQDLVRRGGNAVALRINGCISCDTVRRVSPSDLVASGCNTCDELRNDPQLQQYAVSNGC